MPGAPSPAISPPPTPRASSPRGGVAFGDVITRHGDYYGTVVNLASRLAELAVPGEVLVDGSAASSAGKPFAFRPAGRRLLKGFDEPFEVFSLDMVPTAVPRRVRTPGLNHPSATDPPTRTAGVGSASPTGPATS